MTIPSPQEINQWKEDAEKWEMKCEGDAMELMELQKENNELGSLLQDTAKDRKIVERLKKRIEELVDRANYDEILGEPDCQKVLRMDAKHYCDCEYCAYANELQKILSNED